MPTTNAHPPRQAERGIAGEVLQEYSDNRGLALRVDRQQGVIAGVKLLGTTSKKGRHYPKEVMARALPMYEGMRVNVDHVDPGQRRSLRDRIGLVKNVTLREDGLYGDFHYNPKHALAEQVAWDAENAPQNLGFSHDTRGASRTLNGRVVVESIDKVLSVDLVANPATTNGLFEDQCEPQPIPATQESMNMDWKEITPEALKANRPDLLAALQESSDTMPAATSDELKALQEELKVLRAEKAARTLQEAIVGELKAAGLDPANKAHCSEVFLEDLRATAEPDRRKAKIDDRKTLVAAARPGAPAPSTGSPLQESHDAAAVPPATAPLTERLRRFAK